MTSAEKVLSKRLNLSELGASDGLRNGAPFRVVEVAVLFGLQ
jgi:hypothetical protein